MTLKSRIATVENRDGSKQIVVLDPHSSQVVANYKAPGKNSCDRDVRTLKENMERKGYQCDVIEQTR